MPARAHWKGHLKLSLVTCPIALFPAVSAAARISFRQVNKQTGNRLRQQLVDSVTGEVVATPDKGRGYEIGHDEFMVVEDAELSAARQDASRSPFGQPAAPRPPPMLEEAQEPREEATRSPVPRGRAQPSLRPAPVPEETAPAPPVRIENNHTIEIERCIPASQIDARYHHTPYYIAPRDEVGVEAFSVIRDAMRAKDVVGLGHVILATRERPIMVAPFETGLLGITLRHAPEIRPSAEYLFVDPRIGAS